MWRRPKEWAGKRKELLLNGWRGSFEWMGIFFVNGWIGGFEWLEACFGEWGDMVL